MPRQKLNKRSDGRYTCRYEDKFFYGKTQAEAIQKRDAYIEAQAQGYNDKFSDTTFLPYATEWLKAYRTECDQRTYRQYETFIEYFNSHIRKKLMRDITATDIQKVYNTISDMSESYIDKFTMTIRAIFRSALLDGVIVRDPAERIKTPKGEAGEHRALETWQSKLVISTHKGHDFGLCAMVMLFAGLRRGEALYLNVDRDVDFKKKTITVRGAVSFRKGNQPVKSEGKTKAAKRVIPLNDNLAEALAGHHGLLCTTVKGKVMTQCSFQRKYESYIGYLEHQLNGIQKRWYGRTKKQIQMLHDGTLPPWKEVNIRCHDFRVTFCTMCYDAGVPIKTLQKWMGHQDAQMIMKVYAKLTQEKENFDADSLNQFLKNKFQ